MVSNVADQAMQIFGGAGYSKDYPVERIWREVWAVKILDGTSEMMRRIVSRHAFLSASDNDAPMGGADLRILDRRRRNHRGFLDQRVSAGRPSRIAGHPTVIAGRHNSSKNQEVTA
jgi:hypothetical protein